MNPICFAIFIFHLCFSNQIFSSGLIFAISSTININHQGSNDVERHALLAIKSQITDDPQGVLNSWNDSLPICQWEGVTCSTRHPPQRVVALRLVSYGLVGTLSPYVGNLSFLHYFYLSNNTFRGHIPPQIGNLSKLRSLVLERNFFEGEIPASISKCLNLLAINLGSNHLRGIIPPQLSFLSNLMFLGLQDNQFTGDLLNTVVMNLTSLQTLSAPINSFQGSIPDNIGAVLKSLSYISLAQNKISGTIPPSYYNLSSLQVIDLELNQLEGTLPLDIGFSLPQLTYFKISGNFFHGHVPVSLSNLTQLEELAIYSNNFTGKFVFSAKSMPNFSWLDISLNFLGTGEADDLNFLQTLINCSQLEMLGCGSNNFGGILPKFLGNFSAVLTEIYFDQNRIVGTIPTELFNLINLKRLGLSQNQLTGYLPSQIENLKTLQTFSCSRNRLAGNIPSSLGKLSQLSELYLAENSFEGSLPLSLGECTNLLYLSLSQNNLSGPVPPHLFYATSMLVELHLDHNNLQGIIPIEIEQLRNLVLLDISENAFSGDLPSSLSSCTELVELYMGGNFFNGSIPQSFRSLTSIRYLNLSHNMLSGQIPDFLYNMSLMGLDLSVNNLEGEVPIIGIFANLSAVTLLGNRKLCGGILELHLPSCPPNSAPKGESKHRGKLSVAMTVIIAAACLVVAVSIMSSINYLLYFNRKSTESDGLLLNLKEPFSKVSYDMLLKATDRFSDENILGAGRFGSVYKGVLDPETEESMVVLVAVKVIKLEQKGATESFMAECEALRNIRHRNLLKIVTACSSTDFQGNDFKALVYEFMQNGNLQHWIHNNQHDRFLSLLQRINIGIDVACALDYLHNSCEVPVVHCDLKPSNILLDNDMVAHVGDFGLARFLLHATASNSSSVAVKGTVGYTPPEYGLGSMPSKEGDTYSYGIVLIEMMVAKTPIDQMFEGGLDLHNYAKSALLSDQLTRIIDPRLFDDIIGARNRNQDENWATSNCTIECIRYFLNIGVNCSVESPKDRMRIEDVVRELQCTRDIFLKELPHH